MTRTGKPQPFSPGLTPVPSSALEVRVPTIEHAGVLDDLLEMPRYLLPGHAAGVPQSGVRLPPFRGCARSGRRPRPRNTSSRVGNCGDCKVRLLSGQASGGEACLSDEERRAGWVLSCVATPSGDCVVDG